MNRQLSENAANSRTLILGLVVAMAVLVPLRFYAGGQSLAEMEQNYEVSIKLAEYESLHVANLNRASNFRLAEVPNGFVMMENETAVLGANTTTLENCLSVVNANDLVSSLYETITIDGRTPTTVELKTYASQVDEVATRLCK